MEILIRCDHCQYDKKSMIRLQGTDVVEQNALRWV